MKKSGMAVVMVVLFPFTLVEETTRGDWPNFRGPRHDGISDETGLKTKWTEPIPLLWERNVGSAFSSFSAVGDRLYTCGEEGGQQTLFCLNADTGAVLWKKPIEKAFRDPYGDGTRATPTVHDGKVYVLGGHGRLVCVRAEDGADVWTRQFSNAPTWGYAGSVLIEGDMAVATAGKADGSIAAFHKDTGELVWMCGDDPAGYATPYPFTFNGSRYLVGFTGVSVIVAEARTGRLALRVPWATSYDVNASSPIFHEGHLFVSSGYGTGAGVMKLMVDGDRLRAETVWKGKQLLNKFQSCVLYGGHLFTSDEKSLKCVAFMSGETKWEVRRVKHSPVALADGHLFVMTEDGQLQIAPVSPNEFAPTTHADLLSGKCWSVPVLHRGRFYARNLERIVCFDLRSH